uniref:Threonylcarbamoyl-AMP synthase n=1 Tax=Periophthalmus magnuspinnatus TaxID=409849 RepID=A0A3B3ZA73_9GOBI
GFPASYYGEPGVLGMLSNGISAFLVLLQNFNTARTGTSPSGLENVLARYYEESAISGLVAYIILSFVLAFCSATVNYIMPFVFGAITFTLIFEALGLVFSSWALIVSGVLELLILIFAIYGSAALLLKGLTQRLVLKGFGTPLFNVLLLGTANSARAQKIGEEKKKNTKYAEPMALGFFCDTVSPFIFIFYSFGYFVRFDLAVTWVTIISVAQLFSSYYANLRQDSYHTTKFGLHATYWAIKAWDEFAVSSADASTGREAMTGDWFVILASLVVCAGSLNADWLELVHNLLFLLVTISTIPQIRFQDYYVFFGVSCCLFTAVSLYGTFARLINTIAEKSLIPVGPQPVSAKRLTDAFKCRKNEGTSESRSDPCHASDALFYLVNGIASFSALYGFTAGAIALLVANVFLILIAYKNLVLLITTIVMELALVCFLLSTVQSLPYELEAVLAVLCVVCVYGALASLTNCGVPLGPALLKPCPLADSRLTSGLLKIAALLEDGGVCGIPTDTVYALAASCKNPEAIEKIYNIKDRPAEKPICICISTVEQLVAAAPPFSELLWEFMRSVYPGGVSCIVRKGEWLFKLVGPAYERVGTKDSIMIRVPDHTATGHLCDITGPLAITSANPSGEMDSTHHDMVIRLGHKLQGVLCDGESNETVASTVVNCLNIDESISIVREGCVPAAKVLQIFERIKT